MNKKRSIQDAQLIINYQSGNKRSLSELVKRWHREFCSTSYWIVKDADVAKDIAQDSWKVYYREDRCLKRP